MTEKEESEKQQELCFEEKCQKEKQGDASRQSAGSYPCEVIRPTGNDTKPYPCQLHGEGDL